MPKKIKTNEQLLRELLKDLKTEEAAILRERLIHIAKMTTTSIEKEPNK